MDFWKMRKLIKQNGDKIIVFENGEPEAVVMSFHEYEKLMKVFPEVVSVGPGQETFVPLSVAAMPPEQAAAQEQQFSDFSSMDSFEEETKEPVWPTLAHAEPTGVSSSGLPLRLEDVRLEDLPIEGL